MKNDVDLLITNRESYKLRNKPMYRAGYKQACEGNREARELDIALITNTSYYYNFPLVKYYGGNGNAAHTLIRYLRRDKFKDLHLDISTLEDKIYEIFNKFNNKNKTKVIVSNIEKLITNKILDIEFTNYDWIKTYPKEIKKIVTKVKLDIVKKTDSQEQKGSVIKNKGKIKV